MSSKQTAKNRAGAHAAASSGVLTDQRASEAGERLHQMAARKGYLAPALVLVSLLLLAILPLLVARHTRALWNDIALVAEPTRSLVMELQTALALEAAGTRGYLLTGNEKFEAGFARARARRDSDERRLIPLARRLGPGVAQQAAALTDTLRQADLLLDSLHAGHLSRSEYLAHLDEQQARYGTVLLMAARLDSAVGRVSAARRVQIQRTERDDAALTVALVLLALAAAASAAHLGRAYRSVALRLDMRARQQTALSRIARALGEAERTDDVVQIVADSAVGTTRAVGAYVERLHALDEAGDADVVAASGSGTPPAGARVPAARAPSAALVRSRAAEILTSGATPLSGQDADATPRYPSLAVPLTDHGSVLGALVLLRDPASAPFTPAEVSYAHALGDLASSPLRKFALLEALSESEQHFRQIAENIREFIWLSDPHITRRYYASSGYERIWGRPVQSLYDDPQSAVRSIHPDDRERVRSVALGGGVPQGSYDIEYRVVRPDGEIRWVRSRGFPVRNDKDEVYRIAGITEDITAHKLADLERERLLASERAARSASEEAHAAAERRRSELERVTESRTRLIRGFTHDVKNPLGAADGALALLEDQILGELAPAQLDGVRRVRRSIRAALDLIGNVLELARAEAGQLEIHPQPMDLREIAEEIAEEFRPQAESEGLRLTIDLARELPIMESDPARTRQILANLVSNAVKYTPPGGHVTVTADVGMTDHPSRDPGWVAVHVADTGPGIPDAKHALLFQEFTRFDPSAAHGSGIGLAISQHMARAMGGEICMTSQVGAGSTFTLRLPVVRKNVAAP
ncbi:MAG TPA: ATP-binding protein [Gemmatimonadaceae bacterium]|nr:ATP-binding protein [Gemmatimonadaceae bacterium]